MRTLPDHTRWAPKWHGIVEERIERACTVCGAVSRMRTMAFGERKYIKYTGRVNFPQQFWHDDAAKTSTRPLCKPCLDAEWTMKDLAKLVGA